MVSWCHLVVSSRARGAVPMLHCVLKGMETAVDACERFFGRPDDESGKHPESQTLVRRRQMRRQCDARGDARCALSLTSPPLATPTSDGRRAVCEQDI
jgi:hypothetical protein